MTNFKVSRNLVSESLYEEISFYSFFGTRIILSIDSKAYLLLSYNCVIRCERRITMMYFVFRLIYLPPTLHLGIVIDLFIHCLCIHVLVYFNLAFVILFLLTVKQVISIFI
jgi:hypothetical protein